MRFRGAIVVARKQLSSRARRSCWVRTGVDRPCRWGVSRGGRRRLLTGPTDEVLCHIFCGWSWPSQESMCACLPCSNATPVRSRWLRSSPATVISCSAVCTVPWLSVPCRARFGNLQQTSHPTRDARIRSESPSTAWVRSSGGPASFGPTFPRVAGKSTTTGDPCPDRTGVPH